jgi:hypothetical protein
MAYIKLSKNIIHSTIWRQSHATVKVWIALLALSDRDGIVKCSLPGLIDTSKVTEGECIKALEIFQSPDKYSRTEEYEGRRLVKIPGGWQILNYALYREHY